MMFAQNQDHLEAALFVLGPMDGKMQVMERGRRSYSAHTMQSIPSYKHYSPVPDACTVGVIEYRPQLFQAQTKEGPLKHYNLWAPVGTTPSEIIEALINNYAPKQRD